MKNFLINKYFLSISIGSFLFLFLSGATYEKNSPSHSQEENCTSFKAIIQTEQKDDNLAYYKVTLSCKIDQKYNINTTDKYLFRDQYRFTLYMLEDIFEVISEAEQKCRCEYVNNQN